MDLEYHYRNARRLTYLLDTRFRLLGFSFGIDPILNLIPYFGSIIGGFTSVYILWIAYKINLPRKIFPLMFGNIIIDWLIGMIPVAGVVIDAFYKSNVRNLRIIEKNLPDEFAYLKDEKEL